MIKAKVSGAQKFQAKVQKMAAYFKNEYAPEIIDEVYEKTVKVMPKYSGALIRAFQKIKRKSSGSLIQRMPAQGRRNPRPYHLWLNGTGNTGYSRSDGTRGNININTFLVNRRTGRAMYMNYALKLLEQTAKRKAQEQIKKIK